MPEWIATLPRARLDTRQRRTKKWVDFPLVNDELALLWMVNMGCIDMNAWYSRVDKPDRPDFVLFDLDPTPDVPWSQTIEVALILKELLDALGLALVPEDVRRQGVPRARPARPPLDATTTRARSPSSSPARSRARIPKLATTEWSKARRRGVLIDANQNGEGKTIASVYSRSAEAGRARLDAAPLGRGEREARPGDLHDGRRARPRAQARATCTRAC